MGSEKYRGRKNLEVMQVAENYNSFLKGLVRSNCKDSSSILDFGAGVGTFADIFEFPEEDISCIEPDVYSLQVLKHAGYRAFSSLGETAGGYSYIYSLNVLEHIEEDQMIIDDLYRVLNPGGRLFIYVPALEVLFSAMDKKVGHYRRYHIDDLEHLLENAGFVVEKSAYTDILGVLATLAYKLIPWISDGRLTCSQVSFYDRFLFPISRLLSIPFGRILGKNVYAVAVKPIK